MKLKDILKVVGAGATGVFLALQVRRPSRSLQEFVQILGTIAIEFRHQLETVFLQTMLPAVTDQHRDDLCVLLGDRAEFLDQMRFFQKRLADFDRLLVNGVERLYRLRAEGSIAPTARRRLACDAGTFNVAVTEVFFDLEKAFITALRVNLPEEFRYRISLDEVGLPELLEGLLEEDLHLGGAFFDAIALFQELVADPTAHRRFSQERGA